jgi:hypothetical protein
MAVENLVIVWNLGNDKKMIDKELAPRWNAVEHFDATRLASTWLFAPRKCARSRSERPRTAKTDPKNL